MNLVKESTIRDFEVDTCMYCAGELQKLAEQGIISLNEYTVDYRIYTSDIVSVEVVYSKQYDMYSTAAFTHSGDMVYVIL